MNLSFDSVFTHLQLGGIQIAPFIQNNASIAACVVPVAFCAKRVDVRRYRPQIAAPVIKPVAVYVVHDHSRRAGADEPVHVFVVPVFRVKRLTGPGSPPRHCGQPFKILAVNEDLLPVCQNYCFHAATSFAFPVSLPAYMGLVRGSYSLALSVPPCRPAGLPILFPLVLLWPVGRVRWG